MNKTNPLNRRSFISRTACLTAATGLFILFLAVALSPLAAKAELFALNPAFPDLAFKQPVGMAVMPGDTKRLFVIEKAGRIQMISDVTAKDAAISTMLDLNSMLALRQPVESLSIVSEQGLLGLAFHPDFARNGYCFVFYSMSSGSQRFERLSRFTVKDTAAAKIEVKPDSEYVLIEQLDQAGNHNGGDLHFGADGYLYVSLGDEGGQNDQFGNSQKIAKNFFSGLLRIDVDKRPGNLEPNAHQPPDAVKRDQGSARYAVPKDNPFVDATSFNGLPLGDSAKYVRTEFWAVGIRNAWRFSFDPVTGLLWCGDVGGGNKEEVNLIQRGGNYGWNWREGAGAGPGTAQSDAKGFNPLDPLYAYDHGYGPMQGISITGGIVYRGTRFPSLAGRYVFADFGMGNVWALDNATSVPVVTRLAAQPGLTGFHADPSNGDVLAADYNGGRILRLEAAKEPPPPSPLWSHDNVFMSDFDSLQKLGIKRYVFPCREDNFNDFESTVIKVKELGFELLACRMSSQLSATAQDRFFALLTDSRLHPQIWLETKVSKPEEIELEAAAMKPITARAQKLGCKVAVAVPFEDFGKSKQLPPIIDSLERTGISDIGIVCEFESLQNDVTRFGGVWRDHKPRFVAVILSGLVAKPNKGGNTSVLLGAGDQEMGLMRTILGSGWSGPIGISGGNEADALSKQLRGLDWLARELAQLGSAGPSPNAAPIAPPQPVAWEQGTPGRKLLLRAAVGMQFDPKELRAKAGERLSLTFENPDVMPHNWALLSIGSIDRVGDLANKLITSPDALSNHFVPASDDILCHTRLLDPQKSTTIHFNAPTKPGSYPYLCTFPGHWAIMRGVLVVE